MRSARGRVRSSLALGKPRTDGAALRSTCGIAVMTLALLLGSNSASARALHRTRGVAPMVNCGTNPGGGAAITRNEVLSRGYSWIAEHVPYSQSACKTDANGTYRTDCSGFVSMAWHLSSSLTTATLPSVATQLANDGQLQPGDILNVRTSSHQHVVLFVGWSVGDNGRHVLFDAYEEPHRGLDAQEIKNQRITSAYWQQYTPYRYNNIQASGDVPELFEVKSDGTAYLAGFNADGTWNDRTQLAGGKGWTYAHYASGNFDRSSAQAELFETKTDGTAYLAHFNADGTWNDRVQLAGGKGWDYTHYAAGNFDTRDIEPELFETKPDGTAYLARFNEDGTWKARVQLGGGTGWTYTELAAGNFDASTPQSELIALASDGTAWLISFNTDGTLNDRTQLAGGTGWDYTHLAAANFDTRNTEPELFETKADGTAYLARFNTDGTWSSRTKLAGGKGWTYTNYTAANFNTNQ